MIDPTLTDVMRTFLLAGLRAQAEGYGMKADGPETEAVFRELEAKGYIAQQPDEERGFYRVTWTGADAVGVETRGWPS